MYFDSLFPNGLVVGDSDGADGDGSYAIELTSSQAVAAFLPSGGTPQMLTADALDQSGSTAGVLGAQLVAATLNVAFDDAGIGLCTLTGSCDFTSAPGTLKTLVFNGCVDGGLIGVSVDQVLTWANCAISGADLASCGVPAGVSVADLSDALAVFNQEFVDCVASVGCLRLP